MISSAILAVLSLIEEVLNVVGSSNATTTLVENIITSLTQLMPYIVNEVSTVYTAVKNIIEQLQNSGAPSQDQLDALASLDAQVDAAWTNVQSQIDPDAPGGDPAGSTG